MRNGEGQRRFLDLLVVNGGGVEVDGDGSTNGGRWLRQRPFWCCEQGGMASGG